MKTIENEENRIKYDAFVSYAAEDRFWVHNLLMSRLEKEYGLRLCLHYRDFPAHGDLVDVIAAKIKESRSIVVILSKFSVTRPWCQFELKHAHTQHLLTGKPFIIIKLGNMDSGIEVTAFVQGLLNSQIYIEWPEVNPEPSKQDRKREAIFWGKIQRAIYGQDFCGCFRYCNPCYNSLDPQVVVPTDLQSRSSDDETSTYSEVFDIDEPLLEA